MIKFTVQKVIIKGVPTFIKFVFEDKKYDIISEFLQSELPNSLFDQQISNVMNDTLENVRYSGNMFYWSINKLETIISYSEHNEKCVVNTNELIKITQSWAIESQKFKKSEKKTIIPFSEINVKMQNTVLNGQKKPHSMPRPVIRKENDIFYLSSFIFFFDKNEIASGLIERPSMWVLSNIVDGDIVHSFDCHKKDFSSASFDELYDIKVCNINMKEKKYDDLVMNQLLDSIRYKLIYNHTLDDILYNRYFDLLLKYIPHSYRKFYVDLSNVN